MTEPDKYFHMLVLSDIHAHDRNIEASDAPSCYSTKANYLNNPRLNPLLSIPGVLKEAGLNPDAIVIPGDLADKNDSSAQQVAWRQLEEIKKKIGAKRLIGTVGNHDIDSRRSFPDQLPNCSLKALSPVFPMAGNANADKFWSNGFVVYKLADFDASLAIINSCQLHGIIAGDKAEDEYRRGKIPSEVLENFRVAIEAVKTSKNILLLHHHVRRHPNASDDRSHLENGETLIGILEHMGGPWLNTASLRAQLLEQSDPDIGFFKKHDAGTVSARMADDLAFKVWELHPLTQDVLQIVFLVLDEPRRANRPIRRALDVVAKSQLRTILS